MKPKLLAFILVGTFLLSLSFLNSAAAQEATSTPEPNLTFDEFTPTPEPTLPEPTPAPTEEGVQAFGLAVAATPQLPDPDCSDGQCVFWVSSSTDDAGTDPRFGGCVYRVNANEIYLGQCVNGQPVVSGFRFSNVTLPQGAQIAQAYLEFTVDGPYTDDLTVAFYGEASGNAQPFSHFSRPDNRPLTQVSAVWPIPATDPWTLGEIRTSPDLTAIVQEIVNRSDWASGNALAIIVKNSGSASGPNLHRRVIGYERPVWYPGRENAARLIIRLTTPVSVEILDARGNVVSAQSLNVDGWPTPNPLTGKVTLACPAGGPDCNYYFFSLNIRFSGGVGRFYLYDASLRPDGANCFGDYPETQTTYSTFTLSCANISLFAGDTISHTWNLWIQPSEAFTLDVEAIYGASQDGALAIVPQANIYPVVVIPGLLGSWKNFSGEWEIDPLLGTYNILLDELRRVGYEDGVSLFTFPYDWRQHITDNGAGLGAEITNFLNQAAARPYVRTDAVDILSHSLGGLVSRSYIQSDSYGNNVRRLVTLGTPHLGASPSYLAAEGLDFGEGAQGWLRKAIVSNLAKKAGYCTSVVAPRGGQACVTTDADLHRYIREQVPSLREIFPDRRYLAGNLGGYLVDSNQPSQIYPFGVQVNQFLESLNARIDLLVTRLGDSDIIPVVGIGQDTPSYYQVVQPDPEDVPLWANGKVPQGPDFRKQGAGDNTVASASADLGLVDPRIQSLIVNRADNGQPVIHRSLPTQFQLTSLERLVGIRPPFNAGFSDPVIRNPILFFNLSPVEMQVIDPLARRVGMDFDTRSELSEILGSAFWRSEVPGEPDFIYINDPVEGEYTIRLAGIAQGNYVVGLEAITESGNLTVGTFSGATAPGLRQEHRLNYGRSALPTTPLTLAWLPPLEPRERPLEVRANRTIPIKFVVRDAQGNFVVDRNVSVWVIDPLVPGPAIASFTTESPDGRSAAVRIDEQEELYIVNLRLRDYNFQTGKIYIVGATIFGQPLGTTSFVVVR